MIGRTNAGGGSSGGSKGIPAFEYTGSYEIVDDNDAEITDSAYKGNWKIRLLTSGTLRFQKLNSAKSGIDVFCVGGGGGAYSGGCGGGGGGYTKTALSITLIVNEPYEIIVGAGGVSNAKGGNTSAFGVQANGGDYGYGGVTHPGHGGSGGGSYGGYRGGSDGGDGGGTASYAGKGQGTTTREFGEPTGKLYAGGGGSGSAAGGDGGGAAGGTNAAANTGGGAGGGSDSNKQAHSGGSGIVVIRNARG